MRSIRARILGLVLGVLVLSLTAISLKSYFDAQHEIEELFDAQLAQTARILQGMVGGDMPLATRELMQRALNSALLSQRETTRALPANGHPYEGKLAFQVLDDHGQVLLIPLHQILFRNVFPGQTFFLQDDLHNLRPCVGPGL